MQGFYLRHVPASALALVATLALSAGCGTNGGGSAPPAKTLASLAIDGPNDTLLFRGQSVQLAARATWSDGSTTNATSQAGWNSSAPDVAAVSAAGVVTAQGTGSAQVAATYQGVSGTRTINVDLSADAGWVFLGAAYADGKSDPLTSRIVVDPRDSHLLYLATSNALYVSRDLGATWTTVHTTAGLPLLDMNPTEPDRVLSAAGIKPVILRLSSDRGSTWRTLAESAPTADSAALSRTEPRTIYSPSRAWRAPTGRTTTGFRGPGRRFRSRDTPAARGDLGRWRRTPGTGRCTWPGNTGDHPQPYRPPVLRSADHGRTWQDITGIIPWHCTKIVVDPSNSDVYALTECAGLFRSTDHGQTWTRRGTATFAADVLQDPNARERFFGGDIFFGSRPGGVFLSNDAGLTFVPYGLQQTGQSTCTLALSGDSRLLFAACYGAGIYARQLPPPPSP